MNKPTPRLATGLVLAIPALLILAAATRCEAATPADFVTITPIRDIDSRALAAGYSGAMTNSKAFARQTLRSVIASDGDKYQFVTYYDADQKLVVGRRQLLENGWSDWYLRTTAFTAYAISDTHDVSSIGIDGNGYLHVSWGMHCNTMNYTRSTASVLNSDAFSLQGDTVGNSASLAGEFTLHSSVTYPQFYNVPNSGDLLMAYRTGQSGNGDMELCRWSCDNKAWNSVHATVSDPWINNQMTGSSLKNANAYINGMAYDAKGVLHATWTWRTGGDSTSGYGDFQSNHNVMYAQSPDNGIHWYKQDKTLYERSGVHAIDEDNATPAIVVPEGSSLINQTSMATGPDDTVYMASWWAPETSLGNYTRQYMLNWYDGSEWKTSQISDRNVEGNSDAARITEAQLANFYLARPAVAVDDQNRVIVVFSDCQRGNKVSIAISESSLRNDWKFVDLNANSLGRWEPTIDLSRWTEDGILSMFYQASGSTDMAVLEWDAKAYFAGVPEPSSIASLVAGVAAIVGWRVWRRRKGS